MKTKYVTAGIVIVCAVAVGVIATKMTDHHAAIAPQQNQTNASSMNETPSNASSSDDNTTNSNTTNGTGGSQVAVSTAQQAESIVTDIYASQMAKDSKLKVKYDHMDTSNNEKVYVVHVFDDEAGHSATVGWVDVRADGMVQNDLLKSGWVQPSHYFN